MLAPLAHRHHRRSCLALRRLDGDLATATGRPPDGRPPGPGRDRRPARGRAARAAGDPHARHRRPSADLDGNGLVRPCRAGAGPRRRRPQPAPGRRRARSPAAGSVTTRPGLADVVASRRRRRPRSSPRTSPRGPPPGGRRRPGPPTSSVGRGTTPARPGSVSGTSTPKFGSIRVSTVASDAVEGRPDHRPGVGDVHPLAGPDGPPVQPVLTSQTVASCAREALGQHRGVLARVAGHERRPEAGAERRLRLLDADLGAGQLGGVAADEVVGGLGVGQPRDRRQHAERVGGEQDHGPRLAGHPGRVGVADEVERVGAAGVLGEPLRVEVELARVAGRGRRSRGPSRSAASSGRCRARTSGRGGSSWRSSRPRS